MTFEIAAPSIVITGPTAGGKAHLARRFAERCRVPVLSLDSMKVYRGLDIGTAKPPLPLRSAVPYELMDIRDPWESFSVGDYLQELESLGERLPEPWLFGGGTAFYLNVLLNGIFPGPAPDEELRRRLMSEGEAGGVETLHRRLADADPEAAGQIQPTDLRRIVRALEVIELVGEPFSVLKRQRRPILTPGRFRIVGIGRVREALYQRIDRRVEAMFDDGWVDEVEALIDAHDPAWSPQADQSIGYAQIREALLAGENPRDRLPLIQNRTRHFARHQLVWFRKMPVEWWCPGEEEDLLDAADRWLEAYRTHGRFPDPDPERLTFEGL